MFRCNENVPMLQLADHIKSRHGCSTTVGNFVFGAELWDSEDSNGSCFMNYHHLEYNEENFFVKVSYKENLIYFWVYMVGTDEDTKRYGYKVTLGSEDVADEIVYVGKQVCSLFTSVDCIIHGENGSSHLAIDKSTAKNLTKINSNGRRVLEYKFLIVEKVCYLYTNMTFKLRFKCPLATKPYLK